jgi:hypothetical protein
MKLFHCVVVLGAVGGCAPRGPEPWTPSETGNSGAAGQGAGGHSGMATANGSASGTSGTGGTGGAGGGGPLITIPPAQVPYCHRVRSPQDDPEQPAEPADCAAPQQFICDQTCHCQANAPLVPTDCAASSQFACVETQPDCGCMCDTDRPISEATCAHGWFCLSYDPPVSCECRVVIL